MNHYFVGFVLGFCAITGQAAEKVVLLDSNPRPTGRFELAADGSRLFLAGSTGKYLVMDAGGKLVDQVGVPQGQSTNELTPLSDGSFIAINSYAGGSLNRVRADGSVEKQLVGKGAGKEQLRSDMTGWTSPTGGAVDEANKLIFALDTTMAAKGLPDPATSRIVVFDFDGTFVREINPHDNEKSPSEPGRTWYDDIEVNPKLKRIYVTARAAQEVWSFDYEGNKLAAAKGRGPVGIFPDGRVATLSAEGLQILDADLKPVQVIKQSPELNVLAAMDLEVDAQSRLYFTSQDSTIYFVRLSADFATHERVGPNYLRIQVEVPQQPLVAGKPASMTATVAGAPAPAGATRWQVLTRPSDGRTLAWRKIEPATFENGAISFTPPPDLRGLHDFAIKFGDGPINWSDRARDLSVQMTLAVVGDGTAGSVSVIPAAARRAFRLGESIDLQIITRQATPAPVVVRLELWRGKTFVASTETEVSGMAAMQLPPLVTRRLLPGEYRIVPSVEGMESWALPISISSDQPDSLMQRVLYHEFDNEAATMTQGWGPEQPERQAYVRDVTRATAELGFTRQTDRLGNKIAYDSGPVSWRRDASPTDLSDLRLAPAAFFGVPTWGPSWEAEMYLDEAVRRGIIYDTQLLGHCSSIRFHPRWRPQLVPVIQRVTQWLGRYPSFHGWNWNDEMFFTAYTANEWTEEDKQWLDETYAEKFKDRPRTDMLVYAHDVMYDYFNAALDEVDPSLNRTTTPMWQFPAVDGSYAPAIYKNMSESYTHFLSEGYSTPFVATHNVEFLRRPGKPIIGVFDNGYGSSDGEIYLKNVFQVGFRGVQGVGVQHTRAFDMPGAASALRLANDLMREYGSLLATCPPTNEASILYSYSQDITEQRNNFGTPHWEGVYFMHGASLMAGVPSDIVYEEDVAAGRLMDGEKPRVPILLLVGQKATLPANVLDAIDRFQKAGGKIYYDANSADFPAGAMLPIRASDIGKPLTEGYAADTVFPLTFDLYENAAKQLRELIGEDRRFPVDADEPWVSINQLDGGAIRYVGIARETGRYPFEAAQVWSLGAYYNKQNLPWLPKRVKLTMPTAAGVVYDVFDHRIVEMRAGSIEADLRLVPGRLYAIAPQEISEPTVLAGVDRHTLSMQISVDLAARVPVRIRVVSGETVAAELYRATRADGKLIESIALPTGFESWTLEVTEMLGGKGTIVSAQDTGAMPEQWLSERSAVDIERAAQIRQLLKTSGGKMILNAPKDLLSAEAQKTLVDALKKIEIDLDVTTALPEQPQAGVVLAAGIYPAEGTLPPVLRDAWLRGLFNHPLTQNVPGKGRGLVTALFSPRGYQEHAIGLVGGDAAGLAASVNAFVELLSAAPAEGPLLPKQSLPNLNTEPTIADVAPLPQLSDRAGARLGQVVVSADGKRLLVSAVGWLKNIAIIEDTTDGPKVIAAQRVGASPTVESLYLSADGRRYGGAGRFTHRFGQAMQIFDEGSDTPATIATFGDYPRSRHRFAVSDDGNTVIAPGTYGVACFRREGDAWREAWAVDYWKDWATLDWPVSADAERIPQFHAAIARGADSALVLFGELSNQGWVTPQNHGVVTLRSVNLTDGSERWRFDVPVLKTLLFPTLHTSPAGRHTLLQVQMGSWGKETFRFYNVVDGKSVAEWDSATAPQSVAISDETGWMALVFGHRLVEVRKPDGSLAVSRIWNDQPVSVALQQNGRSIFIADDGGNLTRLDVDGAVVWSKKMGVNLNLTTSGDQLFAAGWDGRLRCLAETGEELWSIDLTPSLLSDEPMQTVADADRSAAKSVVVAARASTASSEVGAGENLLKTGAAKLTVGGTGGWMSNGALLVSAEALTNGRRDDVDSPWLHLDEVFWDSSAGRQVYAEISFEKPTDVHEISVFENPTKPESFPTESVVQAWDEPTKAWKTAARGVFLTGPVQTYRLDLKAVTKLRYVPWLDYYRNFYTSEIEVR